MKKNSKPLSSSTPAGLPPKPTNARSKGATQQSKLQPTVKKKSGIPHRVSFPNAVSKSIVSKLPLPLIKVSSSSNNNNSSSSTINEETSKQADDTSTSSSLLSLPSSVPVLSASTSLSSTTTPSSPELLLFLQDAMKEAERKNITTVKVEEPKEKQSESIPVQGNENEDEIHQLETTKTTSQIPNQSQSKTIVVPEKQSQDLGQGQLTTVVNPTLSNSTLNTKATTAIQVHGELKGKSTQILYSDVSSESESTEPQVELEVETESEFGFDSIKRNASETSDSTQNQGQNPDGFLNSVICDAADGNLVSNIFGAIDTIVHQVQSANITSYLDEVEVEENEGESTDEEQGEEETNTRRPKLTFLKSKLPKKSKSKSKKSSSNLKDNNNNSKKNSCHPEPIEPLESYLFLLEKTLTRKIFFYFNIHEMRLLRLVCRNWKNVLDEFHLKFKVHINRSNISKVFHLYNPAPNKKRVRIKINEEEGIENIKDPETEQEAENPNQSQKNTHWKNSTQADKLIIYDILDIPTEQLKNLPINFQSVKELEIESNRSRDYQRNKDFENPTIGEKNLVEILRLCNEVEVLNFHNGSLGNFGLELLEKKKNEEKDVNMNQLAVGWTWPEFKVQDQMSAVSSFLAKIMGDLDIDLDFDLALALYPYDFEEHDEHQRNQRTSENPADPPLLNVQYKENPPPPFSAFLSLTNIHLEKLKELSLTITPTKNTERMATIALLHVQNFPLLRSFSITCNEYLPDEALYRAIFKFIVKHQTTLRYLTFINPILSTKINTSPMRFHIAGLEKVRLREILIAWEVPLGLDVYWSNGHYLLERQRKLSKLELHSTNVVMVESVVCNNFRYLKDINLDVTDTSEPFFDCSCFSLCARLQSLSLHVEINVTMKNVDKIPTTIKNLHWDCLYTRDDVEFFSHFLILATSIYLYHDKNVPVDIFTPLNYSDFLHFIRLPCIEQLFLPKIHIQDPRVNRFCERKLPGLIQERDLFFIDRHSFKFPDDT